MSLADPFHGIAAFVRAAEARSFTRADRLLGLTPSAVSKSVSRLEGELGLRLFNRSPREVTLTGEGEAFFIRCRNLVHDMEDLRALIDTSTTQVQGKLRVCVQVTFGQNLLVPALPAWLAANPGIQLETVFSDRHADLVEERFDAAIRLGDPRDSRLIARALPRHVFWTAASPYYLAQHGEPLQPQDLSSHNCLGYLMAATGSCRIWNFEHTGTMQEVAPQGNFSADHSRTLRQMAVADCGIVQLPRHSLAPLVEAGRLQRLLSEYESYGPSLWLVYPHSRQQSLKLQAFAALVMELGTRI